MAITLLFIALLFLSGLFSATEIAFFSLRPSRVRLMVDKHLPGAKYIQLLLKKPEELLITILIGNNIVNTFTAALATIFTTNIFGSKGLGIATGVVTFFILMFGEITPKAFAQSHNEWLAQHIAPGVYWFTILLSPVVWVLRILTQGILFPFRKRVKTNTIIMSREELKTLSKIAHEHGAVDAREHELITSVLRFADHEVKDIFIPMHKVVCLKGATQIDQIAYTVAHEGYSRYPVYNEEKNDIIGYIHVNDILRLLNSDDRSDELFRYVRPITKVSLNNSIEEVFRVMKRRHEHIALVVGNKKQALGIVTLENVLEELVGEIEDEMDDEINH